MAMHAQRMHVTGLRLTQHYAMQNTASQASGALQELIQSHQLYHGCARHSKCMLLMYLLARKRSSCSTPGNFKVWSVVGNANLLTCACPTDSNKAGPL